MRRKFFLPLLLVTLSVNTNAQQFETRPLETGLALEVGFEKGIRPSFQPVPWHKQRGGSWYARFKRMGHDSATNLPTVNAVRVVSHLQGELVRVTVSVLRGRFLEVEKQVGSYSIREGEQIETNELTEVGIAPFTIRVIRMPTTGTNPPRIVNRTKSLEVVGLEGVVSNFPQYKITAHNSSAKSVRALFLRSGPDVTAPLSTYHQGRDGENVFAPGGYSDFLMRLPLDADLQGGSYRPNVASNYQIVIATAIFEDGSYEGELGPAQMFLSFEVGRKLALEHLNSLIDQALNSDRVPEPAEFALVVNDFSYEVQQNDLAALSRTFPRSNPQEMKSGVEIALNGMKKELLDGIKAFEKRAASKESFREWLLGSKERYSTWLARINGEKP
jgi:hypothetical protein